MENLADHFYLKENVEKKIVNGELIEYEIESKKRIYDSEIGKFGYPLNYNTYRNESKIISKPKHSNEELEKIKRLKRQYLK